MTTTSVTATTEVEAARHFADCDSLAIGRRVKEILANEGRTAVVFLTDIIASDQVDKHRGNCQCFALQLTRVEADLAARRKAQRAGYDREAEIEQLLVARDALRQAVAR